MVYYFACTGQSWASVGLVRSRICACSVPIYASLVVEVHANAGMTFPFTQTALIGCVLRGCLLTLFPPSASVLSCFPLLGLRSGESFAYLLSPLVSVDGQILPPIDINVHCLRVSFEDTPDANVWTATCPLAFSQLNSSMYIRPFKYCAAQRDVGCRPTIQAWV